MEAVLKTKSECKNLWHTIWSKELKGREHKQPVKVNMLNKDATLDDVLAK